MKTLASSSTKNRSAIFTNKYSKNNLLTISLLILYLVSIFIQQKIITATELKAIFAQIQVLISICMVLVGNKKSYIASVSVNLFTCIIVFIFFFTSKNRSFIPGTLVPLITIFSISIIYLINMKLNNTINKLKENNEILEKSGKELDKLANYDYLTGLPNRKMIFNKIDDLIEKSSKSSSTFSLVYIDVDNFKNINDTLGHPIGDLLLQSITARFKTIIDSNDFLGRLGGDEFALIIQKNLSKEDTLKYVRKLMSLLFEPFNINNIKFSINFSCGISIFPEDGEISSELLKNSDTAMYNVKSQGKNDINFFTKKMRDDIIKKMEIAYHLSFSIKNEELFLVFQPQYTTYSKKLRGFESLLRWKSGKLGTISPGDFIPIAEEM
ncbi:MAG: diguanylate cyclase, partial [Bacillota bacterium]|nr:diguanylate cyclase [Bacillota bacterium]